MHAAVVRDNGDDDAGREAVWLDLLATAYAGRRSGQHVDLRAEAGRHPAWQAWLLNRLPRLTANPGTAPDDRCIGPYRLLREIGRGGQAVVFEAEDPTLHRSIALKVLRGGPALHPRARTRFTREAALAAHLADPGLCAIHATGQDGDEAWIAMQLLPGGTLRERLDVRRAAGSAPDRTTTRAAVAMMSAVLRTLHRLHEAGVVHRDLKPANLGFDEQDHPVVLDLGLAVADTDEAHATRTDPSLGTPAYMAPEQIEGLPSDRRTDVHAVGIMLYEAIALRHPFLGRRGDEPPTRERLYRTILAAAAPPLARDWPAAGVDRDLDAVLATALAKAPDRRYATTAAFADDLDRWLRGRPVAARTATVGQRVWRWCRREPRLAIALATTLLTLLGGLATTSHLLVRLRGEQAATAAALREARATALRSEAERLQPNEPQTSLCLALAAHSLQPDAAARSTVYDAWARLPAATFLPAASDVLVRAATSADRRHGVLGCADGSARLWHFDLGTSTALPRGEGTITAVAINRDGSEVALAHGRVLTLWRRDAPSARDTDEGTIYAIASCPGDRWITGHADGRIVARDRDGAVREVGRLATPVLRLLAGDDGTVAAFGADRSVQVTSAADAAPVTWSTPADAANHAIHLIGSGTLVTAGPTPRTLRLFTTRTRETRDLPVPCEPRWFVPVGDGRRILVLGNEGRACLLNVGTGNTQVFAGDGPIVAIAADERGCMALAAADGTSVVVLPDGRRRTLGVGNVSIRWLDFTAAGSLQIVGEDAAGMLWSLRTLALAQPAGGLGVHAMARFGPDGTLFGATSAGLVALRPDQAATPPVGATGTAAVDVACSPDLTHLLAQLPDGGVEVLGRTGRRRAHVPGASSRLVSRFLGVDRFVALHDRAAHLHDLDGHRLATATVDERRTTALACASSGKAFAIGSETGDVVVFDSSGRRRHAFACSSSIDELQFGPGDRLAAAERDGEVTLAGHDGTVIATWRAHAGRVTSIDFAPGGDLLLVAGEDGLARVFAADGSLRRELRTDAGPLLAALFVPRQDRVVTVSQRGSVQLWTTTGERLAATRPTDRAPTMCSLSPGGDWLALSGLGDGFVLLPLDEATLLAAARGCVDETVLARTRERFSGLLAPGVSR